LKYGLIELNFNGVSQVSRKFSNSYESNKFDYFKRAKLNFIDIALVFIIECLSSLSNEPSTQSYQ